MTVECSAINGTSTSSPDTKAKEHHERGIRKHLRAGGNNGVLLHAVLWHGMPISVLLSHQLRLSMQDPLTVDAINNLSWGRVHDALSP